MENNKKAFKQFSNEFKKEAVNRSYETGIKKTSEELAVGYSTLTRWRKEFTATKPNKVNTKPCYEDLERENKKLKKEIAYIEEINRILKKSTAIFSSNQMTDLK